MKARGHGEIGLVVPTLNAERYLGASLASIRAVYPEAELIVVDSGSKDRTVPLAKSFDAIVRCVPSGNLYAAVNEGVRNLKSRWWGYLNADDLILGRLDPVVGSICYGAQNLIGPDSVAHYRWKMTEASVWGGLLASGVMPMYFQGSIISMEVFEMLGGFDERYRFSADFDFVLRAYLGGVQFVRSRGVVGAFRLHDAQISQRARGEMRAEVLISVQRSAMRRSWFSRGRSITIMRFINTGAYITRWWRFLRRWKARCGFRNTLGVLSA